MVVACNTAACSLPSHNVTYTTRPSHSPTMLYKDSDSSTLLFRDGDNIKELCVPLSYTPKITSDVCTQLPSTKANLSGVISLGLDCQQTFDDLAQCAFKCPKITKECEPTEKTIYLRDACGHQHNSDVLSPTELSKSETHSISTTVLVLAVVISILGTVVIMAVIAWICHFRLKRRKRRQERQRNKEHPLNNL
ncbi:uncharacterized protein LOC134176847 isoform X2 [Corticium candelabrum]|uniref:uncharacterized protein LOC134176847 isoform X2 n=1 Tax=Corticium candelabrum TaxID=121492 RepID=UPI002E25B0CE|nr:uncharacterized protein LOC134176847 isoform X2 [Corticium candelabrum]